MQRCFRPWREGGAVVGDGALREARRRATAGGLGLDAGVVGRGGGAGAPVRDDAGLQPAARRETSEVPTLGPRQEAEAEDGRSQLLEKWLGRREEDEALNLVALHEDLVAEHDYPGSVRSVRCLYRAHYPPPKKPALRRVKVPAGGSRREPRATGRRSAGGDLDLESALPLWSCKPLKYAGSGGLIGATRSKKTEPNW